jgi:hypothetical protein
MVGRPSPMRLFKISAATIGAVLAMSGTAALAQSPSEEGYSTPGGVVQTQLNSGGGGGGQPGNSSASPAAHQTATTNEKSSKLPFTGLDLALVVAAGGMLVLLGFGIRRLSRPSEVV